jgi:glycosyltransferase involved in cell wall biosynthesis
MDVVVLPFTKILTSASTVLAMSFHKPVIIPNMGCLPELIWDGGGWLFESGSVEDLIAAMQKAIQSREALPEIGEQAFQQVIHQNQDTFGAQTAAIYRQ